MSEQQTVVNRPLVLASRADLLLVALIMAGSKLLDQDIQFWQHNHPLEINSNEMIAPRIEYVHDIPIESRC